MTAWGRVALRVDAQEDRARHGPGPAEALQRRSGAAHAAAARGDGRFARHRPAQRGHGGGVGDAPAGRRGGTADLAAETFAAALAARRRYRPERGRADSWLFSIAYHKLADAQRRGAAEDRARRRLGMERIDLTDGDLLAIERLAEDEWAGAAVARLAPDQREAIRAHVVGDRSYADIAHLLHTSEPVVRQRVSRGLATIRKRLGDRA